MTARGVILMVLVFLAPAAIAAKPRYTNSWAVEVRGGPEAAHALASKHGFVNHGQVRGTACRHGDRAIDGLAYTCAINLHGVDWVGGYYKYSRVPNRSTNKSRDCV